MIVHILPDDKFSDYAIKQFSRENGIENRFVVILEKGQAKCKSIHQKDSVQIIESGSHAFKNFIDIIYQYKAIIFHNISTPDHATILDKVNSQIKIAWIFWGFEVYNRRSTQFKYLGLYSGWKHLRFLMKQALKFVAFPLINRRLYKVDYEIPKRYFRKVHYCLTDISEDHKIAEKHLKTNFEWLWYNYYSIEETIGPLKSESVNGENILVGNSAYLMNNHLEVFKTIKNFDLENRKIIVPLSYGDQGYARFIKKRGEKILGPAFSPLAEFLPLEEYNRIIQTCRVVIMNQYRHQAMGNIITMLWLGARVYLSEKSSTYKYFKRLGVHVFSVEKDLRKSNSDVFASMPEDLVKINREILFREYGRDNMNVRIRDLILKLNS